MSLLNKIHETPDPRRPEPSAFKARIVLEFLVHEKDAIIAQLLASNEGDGVANCYGMELKSVVTEPFYGPDEMEG